MKECKDLHKIVLYTNTIQFLNLSEDKEEIFLKTWLPSPNQEDSDAGSKDDKTENCHYHRHQV